MRMSMEREKVRFPSGGTECAAWHYPGTNGACVVMAPGGGVTKEPGTDPFAARFHAAGFGVLAFDYRRFGESGGVPRQILDIKEQLADWRAAIACAAALPEVDPARVAAWGFSASGGHIFQAAARAPQLAAAIAQTPLADGPVASRRAMAYQTRWGMLRLTVRGLLDAAGGLVGRKPLLVPLAGPPGTVALLTTPDGNEGDRALNPGNRYPDWQQEVAARSALSLSFYRPGRRASRARCPLLVVVCDQDRSALPGPAVDAARRAPQAEVVHLPGGHYAPFTEAHEPAVEAELAFLQRHLLGEPPADHGAAVTADPSARSRS
ncbi:alpha/beta hydrolase [Streptomyces sp. NPDC057636]|uniref:alpha/beta hydrolase n=1 Tax=Streptomyces sp. NPDC057636 TaxID=3346189 RepID=UPI00369F0A7D